MYAERPASRWDSLDRFTDNYSLATCGLIAVLLLAIGSAIAFFSVGGDEIDKESMSDAVVSHSDLPAPPFTGWTREDLDEPVPASAFGVTDQWDPETCRSDSDSYEGLDATMTEAEAWSGASFYNAALDNTLTVQVAASREGDITAFHELRDDCGSMTATDGDKEYFGSMREMPDVAFKKLNFSTGVEWVTEHSVYDGDELDDNRSTAVVVAVDGDTKVQVSITIPGPMEDDAIRSMELVLRLQAAKLAAINGDEADD